jgi:hypothetical protein
MSLRTRLSVACLLLAACAARPGPEVTAEAYADALEEGRLADAWARVQEDGLTREAFFQRYADEQRRRQRAVEVRAAVATLRAEGPGLKAVHTPEGWRVVEVRPEADSPEAVLRTFLDAAEAGDFARAYRLLSGPLRARYTPALLERDFRAEAQAPARLARARQALVQPHRLEEGGQAVFPIGGASAVRLVREEGTWRVASLE